MSEVRGVFEISEIFEAVSVATGVRPRVLTAGNNWRTNRVTVARALFVGICRELGDWSYPKLSRYLCLKSHTSCVAQFERYARLMESGQVMWFGTQHTTMGELTAAVFERLGVGAEAVAEQEAPR